MIKTKFQSVWAFKEGIAPVESKDRYGYIDRKGKYIWKNVFLVAHEFCYGLGRINFDGEWGYINPQGEWIYKPKVFNL